MCLLHKFESTLELLDKLLSSSESGIGYTSGNIGEEFISDIVMTSTCLLSLINLTILLRFELKLLIV